MGNGTSSPKTKEQTENKDTDVRDKSPEVISSASINESNTQQQSHTDVAMQDDSSESSPGSSTDNSNESAKLKKYSKTKIASLEAEVQQLKDEKHTLLIRLSEIGSDRLTEHNPNIADLSDFNRPEKLVEQFSELYDNEWTNAFECLTKVYGIQDSETIRQLLDILQEIYKICMESTRTQADDLAKAITAYVGLSEEDKDTSAIKKAEKILKERRAKEFRHNLGLVKKVVREKLKDQLEDKTHEALDKYVEKCIRVCWLMCIKDPQMHLYFGENQNERSSGDGTNDGFMQYDATKFVCYTRTGRYLEYVVWPAVLLYKNGPIVKKGVAQGIKAKIKESTGTNYGGNNKDIGDQSTAGVEQKHTEVIPIGDVLKRENMEPDLRRSATSTNYAAEDECNENTKNRNKADCNGHNFKESNQDNVLCEDSARNNGEKREKSSDEKKKATENENWSREDGLPNDKNVFCNKLVTETNVPEGSNKLKNDSKKKKKKKKKKSLNKVKDKAS